MRSHQSRSSCLQTSKHQAISTLYIREVSDDLAETLEERAAAEGKSPSAHAAGELSKIASRPTNTPIVTRLRGEDRSVGPTSEEIVQAVLAGRRVIVVDASAMVEALVGRVVDAPLIDLLEGEIAAPHLLDVEVMSALQRRERRSVLLGEGVSPPEERRGARAGWFRFEPSWESAAGCRPGWSRSTLDA
jgi:hypothetical protein